VHAVLVAIAPDAELATPERLGAVIDVEGRGVQIERMDVVGAVGVAERVRREPLPREVQDLPGLELVQEELQLEARLGAASDPEARGQLGLGRRPPPAIARAGLIRDVDAQRPSSPPSPSALISA
jgi:hypothetical protein